MKGYEMRAYRDYAGQRFGVQGCRDAGILKVFKTHLPKYHVLFTHYSKSSSTFEGT